MKGNLKIQMKPKERIYINGGLLRVDRRVTLELLNEMDFLLECNVLHEHQETTPLRQLYFVIQSMLIEPQARGLAAQIYEAQHRRLLETIKDRDVLEHLVDIKMLVASDRIYDALKRLRSLFAFEDAETAELQTSGSDKMRETA